MKRLLTLFLMSLTALSLAAMPDSPEKDGKPAKDRQKTTLLFGNKTETRKALLQQRDSLLRANALLQMQLDSLWMANEILAMEDVASGAGDTAACGFIETTGLDQFTPTDTVPVTIDSLLSLWYQRRNLNPMDIEPSDIDTIVMTSDIPDSVYIERLQKLNSFISVPYNSIIRNHIIYYTQRMPDKMERILGLSAYYIPIFEEIFDKYDLPLELTAMAVIESALNAKAVSRARAKGMWQFMYSTAKLYGLHIDSFVDERLDPVKSAHAAAEYLKDAYNIFGDWNLAIASYNCGAGNVNRAIRRSGGKRNFWDIYPYLPRETRGYVPAFVGALYTMTYYKEHGIVPENIEIPAHIDTFHIHKMLHFKQVSALTGAPEQELKNLNPQYRHEIVPGNDRDYILRLPYTYTNAFIDNEDSLYTYKADEYFNPVVIKKIKDGGDGERIIHRVRSGEVLGRIAMRYHVSVRQIKRWNNLRSDNIRIGQRLVIYRGGNGPATSTASASSSSSSSSAAKSVTAQKSAAQNSGQNSNAAYTIYVVKSGDSLYSIAKHYPGISAQNIMDYNGISSKIKPGMKIKIPKKA